MRPRLLALLLIASTLLAFIPTPAAALAPNGTENFENDSVGSAPTADFYTFTGGASNVVENTVSVSSPNAVIFAQGGSNLASFGSLPNLCSAPNVVATFSFRLTSLAFGGGNIALGFGGKVGGIAIDDTTGLLTAVSNDAPSNQHNSATIITVAINTWYRVELSGFKCNGVGSLTVRFPNIPATGTVQNPSGQTSVATIQTGSAGGAPSWPTVYIDDLVITGYPVTLAAAASVATTTLIGFDVDPTGTTLITREGTGTTIRTFAASNLGVGGSATSTCTRQDGVAAMQSYATYADCVADPNIVSTLRIRSNSLTDPVFPSGSSCRKDPTTSGFVTVPPQIHELGRIHSAPWDGTVQSVSSPNGVNRCLFAWAYSTTDGKVGIYAVDDVGTGNKDRESTSEISFDPTGLVSEICAWHNTAATGDAGDPQDMMAAVSGNGPSNIYRTTANFATANTLVPTTGLDVWTTPSSSYGAINSVGCGQYRVLLASTAGVLAVIQIGPTSIGSQVWGKTGQGAIPARGAAMSGDGNWVIFTDATTVHILNGTTGAETGQFSRPTCSQVFELSIDYAGQSAWFACSSNTGTSAGTIYRYALQANGLTTLNPVSTNPGNDVGGGTGTSTSGPIGSFFGVDPARFDPAGQGNLVSGGFVLSLFIIIAFTALGAAFIPSKNPATMIWGAGLGALLGFAWTVFLGTMPPLITFLLVVLGVGIIGFKVKSGSGSAV